MRILILIYVLVLISVSANANQACKSSVEPKKSSICASAKKPVRAEKTHQKKPVTVKKAVAKTSVVPKKIDEPLTKKLEKPESGQTTVTTTVSPVIVVKNYDVNKEETSRKAKPARVIERVVVYKEPKEKIKIQYIPKAMKKNIISLAAGIGPTNVQVDVSEDSTAYTRQHSAVGGLQYQRVINDNLVMGLQIMSNTQSTVIMGFGF